MDESTQPTDIDEFWPVLEERICERIREIDAQVRELYRERDRMQFFLNDHKSFRRGGEGSSQDPPPSASPAS